MTTVFENHSAKKDVPHLKGRGQANMDYGGPLYRLCSVRAPCHGLVTHCPPPGSAPSFYTPTLLNLAAGFRIYVQSPLVHSSLFLIFTCMPQSTGGRTHNRSPPTPQSAPSSFSVGQLHRSLKPLRRDVSNASPPPWQVFRAGLLKRSRVGFPARSCFCIGRRVAKLWAGGLIFHGTPKCRKDRGVCRFGAGLGKVKAPGLHRGKRL